MRFITLTTIAALAFASVSALPVNPSKGVGVPPKDIPLSKRTDELNGNPAPVTASGSGQDNGGSGIKMAKIGDTPQEQSPLSKRTDQVGDNTPPPPPVAGNGIKKAKIDDTPPEQNPLSKRHKKSKDESGSGKKDDGAAATGEPNPLSKRTNQVDGSLPPGNDQDAGNPSAKTDEPKRGPLDGLEDL